MDLSFARRFATLAAVAFSLLLGAGASLLAQSSSDGGSSALLIRGATVLTITRGILPDTDVLVRDGRIAEIGTTLEEPDDGVVIDATGLFLTPGLVDAHSHIAADSINESGTTVSSMTGIEDVLDPTDINIHRALAGGVTTANLLHGSANPIGGKSAVIKLRWGRPRMEDLLFQGAMPGIKFALGENPKRQSRQPNPPRYPTSRPGVEFVIRDAMTRAKTYQREWQEYERKTAAGEPVLPPRRDLQLEPLVEVLDGRRLVHAHAYRADEILMLIRLAEEMGFRIATFQHVLEGYKVARALAAHGAGASTFSDWWGYKAEAIDAIPYNAALLMRAGVLVSINSDSPEHARRLNTEAAKSIKWGGLTEEEALALVTINPARQLRIDDRVGSIDVGKDADLVLWSRHPLSSYAIVERVFIDGTEYYARESATEQHTSLGRERRTLMASLARTMGGGPTDDVSPSFLDDETPEGATAAERPNGDETNGGGESRAPGTPPLARRSPAGALDSPGPPLALVNARIHPVTAARIERGVILIRDGLIEAVGADLAPPPDARVIDVAGADVYPGWIDARSTIGIVEPGAAGFQDNEETFDFNPQLRTVVAFHTDSDAIPVARANGVTTAGVMPAGGVLAGQVAVMNLDGWSWEEAAVSPMAGIAFQFPALRGERAPLPRGERRSFGELRRERDRKLKEVSDLLQRAREYAEAEAGRRDIDWLLEALVPLVRGEVPLVTEADRARDIREAIAFADREGVKLVISGGLDAPAVARLLREKNVPVILGPVLTLPLTEDAFHAATYQAAGALVEAGVRIAFATGSHTNVRLLPYHAAQSVAWGLPRDEAIRALTIGAAEILGVDDRLGSLEPGKIANLLVARGDPLEVRTEVSHVIIGGRLVDPANRHLTLYERYRDRR